VRDCGASRLGENWSGGGQAGRAGIRGALYRLTSNEKEDVDDPSRFGCGGGKQRPLTKKKDQHNNTGIKCRQQPLQILTHLISRFSDILARWKHRFQP